MLARQWTTARTRVSDVSSDEVPELAAVFASASDSAPLDPTFHPVDESEIADLVAQSGDPAKGSRQFQMQAIRLLDAPDIIGYWHCRRVPDVPQTLGLSMFVLRPPYRRHGYGSEVVKALLRLLRADGAMRAVWGRVYLRNLDALRFWTCHGFTRIIQRHGTHVHVDGQHANVVLESDLSERIER